MGISDGSGASGRDVFDGRYEILSKVSEGGFGIVFKARQRSTGQLVAIKRMRHKGRTAAERADYVARFQREMRLYALLNHPNIVGLVDSGYLDGELVMVFELVPGHTLAEVLAAEHRIRPQEVGRLMAQVLDAVSCAHNRGVIHRDLKPSNIMLVDTGARRNALVLDFGIGALSEEATRMADLSITAPVEIAGTPAYAAPEQLRSATVTAQADLYSWGLVFLECLTGAPIAMGETATEMFHWQLSSAPVPMPRALASHPLGQLLAQVTVKDLRRRRHLKAGDVLRDLATMSLEELDGMDLSPPASRARLRRSTGPDHAALPAAMPAALIDHDITLVAASEDQRVMDTMQAAAGDTELASPGSGSSSASRRARHDEHRQITVLSYVLWGDAGGGQLGSDSGGDIGDIGDIDDFDMEDLADFLAEAHMRAGDVISGAGGDVAEARNQRGLAFFGYPRAYGDDARRAVSAGLALGRDEELALLMRSYQRAERGNGQVMLMSGEAGIGKSRLVRELERLLAGTPHTWLEWRCLPETRQSWLHPVAEALDRLLETSAGTRTAAAGPADKATMLAALLADHGLGSDELMAPLAALLGLPPGGLVPALIAVPQRRKELTQSAVLGLLGELAVRVPLVLMIEDLHWADSTTMELLELLVDEVPMARICIVATVRPEHEHGLRRRSSDVAHIQLGRLSGAGIEALATAVAGGKALPPEVIERIADRTDGVPFFVEELTRAIVGSSALEDTGAGYALRAPITTLAVPATLRDSLMARLDRLGEAKEVAQLAAVIGREFSVAALTAVSEPGAPGVRASVDALLAADIVHRRRRQHGEVFCFNHALIQETAYDSLPRRVRTRYHSRIASAYASFLSEIAARAPEQLAYHHGQAGEHEQAVDYAIEAGRAALQRSASAAAMAAAEQGLGWLPALEGEHRRGDAELALLAIRISALMAGYGYDDPDLRVRLERAAERIERLCRTGPLASPHALVPFWGLHSYHFARAEHGLSGGYADRCLAVADAGDDRGQQVLAAVVAGLNRFYTGRFGEAEKHFERALARFQSPAHDDHIMISGCDSKSIAHGYLALVSWMSGRVARAAEHILAGMARAAELDQPVNTALLVFLDAKRSVYQGDREAVGAAAERLMAIAQRYRMSRWHTIGKLLRGWAQGDAAVDAERGEGYRLRITFWKALAAESCMASGALERALALVDECVHIIGETGERSHEVFIHRLRGQILAVLVPDQPEAAIASFERAMAVAREQGALLAELMAATALSRLLVRHGRRERARAVLAPLCAALADVMDAAPVAAAHALLAELAG